MKKKLIHGFFMGAALVASMSSVVSCTDAEEDRFAEFQNAIARDSIFVREVFAQQYDSLEALRIRLAALEAMCRTNCQNIQNQLANYVTIAQFQQYQTTINNKLVNYYTKTEIDGIVTNLTTTVQNLIDQSLTGYVKQSDLATALAQYYTQAQVDAILSQYATNAQVQALLANYYDKATIDAMMAAKANATDVYTRDQVYSKAEIDALIAAIAIPLIPDVYTKTEIDNKIKDFIKREDVVTVVLAQVQDAQSEISKAIENNVIQAVHAELFGTGANKMTIDQLVAAVNTIEQAANKAQADATEALNWVNNNKETFNQYGLDITNLKGDVTNIKNDINTVNGNITNLETLITTLQGRVTSVEGDIAFIQSNYVTTTTFNELSNTVAGLQTTLAGLQTKLTTVESTANSALSKANANYTAIRTLRTRTDSIINALNSQNADLTRRIDSLATEGAALAQTVAENKAEAERLINEVSAAMAEADRVINERIDSVAGVTAAHEIKFNEIEAAYQAADDALQDQITDLGTEIAALDTRLTTVEDDIAALTSTFKNTMAKLITSVVIQGTENPILGEAALPVDLQSNILAGYFGYAKGGVTFPSIDDDADYAFEDDFDRITPMDMAMLGSIETVSYRKDQLLTSDSEDNAGTLYLTINPNTANFEGTRFTLVNSRDEEAGLKLGEVKASDHKLRFGYSWTRANNAFYEAPAKITNPTLAMPKFDLNAAKEAASAIKDILSRKGSVKANATTVAKAIASNLKGLELDRYGVKATWTDDQGEHSTYSNYNIAAVAMRGMSFGFAKEYQFDHIPGIGKIESLIGKAIDKVLLKFPRLTKDLKELPITSIKLINLNTTYTAGTFVVTIAADDVTVLEAGTTFQVIVPAQYNPVTGALISPAHTETFTIGSDLTADIVLENVDITDAMNAILQDIQNDDNLGQTIKDANAMIEWLNTYLDDVNSAIKFFNKWNDGDVLKDKIFEFIDKFSDKYGRFFSPNKYLQPLMLARSTNGIARLSESKALPTTVSNQFVMIPTSWTAEIIAPAFKKFIAVTNVYDPSNGKSAQTAGGDYKAALDAANKGDLKKVLDGDRQKVMFTADSRFNGRGYIYELLYTALDFDGKIVARKFYVKVQ